MRMANYRRGVLLYHQRGGPRSLFRDRERLRCVLRYSSRHRAERTPHFAHDRFCVGYAVSVRDPARFVIRQPCCPGCIFPNERLQWQIDSDGLRRSHQGRAAAGVAEDDELSRS